jgi:hypothetical protein
MMKARPKVVIEDRSRLLRVVKALGYPKRIDVLLAHAEHGSASASMLCRLGVGEFPGIYYHQQKGVAVGVLKKTGERDAGGSVEHFYGLTDWGWRVLGYAELLGQADD